MKVTIYSTVDVFYYSFYIEGLYRLYGKRNVKFSASGFPAFAPRILAVRINENGRLLKVIIDALDTPSIYCDPLEWCDVYGKVNYNNEKIPLKNSTKILAIGPSFGIRLWSFTGTVQRALQNYLKSGDRIFDRKYFFTSYWRQLKRLSLQVYEGSFQVKSNYVYFISSLWQKEMLTNRSRANFIEVCIESEKIIFEGGFAPRSDYKTLGFKSLIDKRITLDNYLRKIKDSFVSFNTPAVQGCFGWKLAEYMVLGKAIISTDIHNVLPAPFEDRKHLHFVSSAKEEIRIALNEILEDHDYRKSLEKHSKEYYHNHLAPEVVVKKLVGYKQEEKNNFD